MVQQLTDTVSRAGSLPVYMGGLGGYRGGLVGVGTCTGVGTRYYA